jgi:hypothetical protein
MLRRVKVEERQYPATRWNSRLQLENAYGRRKPESAVTRSTRIHHGHDHIDDREERPVGVTIDQDIGVWECGVEPCRRRGTKLIAVGDHNVETFQSNSRDLRQPATHVIIVGVAVYRCNRGQGLELGQEMDGAQVTGVNDMIHFLEGSEDLGT